MPCGHRKSALYVNFRFRALLQRRSHRVETAANQSAERQHHQRCEDARKRIGCGVAAARIAQRFQPLLAACFSSSALLTRHSRAPASLSLASGEAGFSRIRWKYTPLRCPISSAQHR